jgi:bifunctional Delta-12/omega-3 fatty acid desaturase
MWIVGHECGHGSFSDSNRLNDFLGWVVHSSLLVPYFSWKITHARHHRYTNNIEKDTAFVPETWKSAKETETSTSSSMPVGGDLAAWGEMIHDTPLYTTFSLLRHQLLGWQAYLFFYVTAGPDSIPTDGAAKTPSAAQSHFDPFSALWLPSQRHLIVLTDLGLILVGTALYFLGQSLGASKVVFLYFVPYFWVHHWLGKALLNRIYRYIDILEILTYSSCNYLSAPHPP